MFNVYHRRPSKTRIALALLATLLQWAVYAFVALSVTALAFRWAISLDIEVTRWFLVHLFNPLAGLYPGTH